MAGKYKAQRAERSGEWFDSKLEASIYDILKLRERAKEIKLTGRQSCIYLTAARIQYWADFSCIDLKTGEAFWVEAKGVETPVWRIKRKLWPFYGPGTLEIYKGSHNRPYLHETLTVKSSCL